MTPKRPVHGYIDPQLQPDALVADHIDLVHRIAHHLAARLPPSVQLDDLMQSGMIGLIEASRQYQSQQGATFASYAALRIRGAMIDELRRVDWAPRSVHRNSRRIAAAIHDVEMQTGRAATDREVAKKLEVGLDEYHLMLQDSASANILAIDDLGGEESHPDSRLPKQEEIPTKELEQEQFRKALVRALDHLPEREQLILNLYYDEELNLREIGAVLGITESRVSQIRTQAIHRLRARLPDWIEDESL